MFQGFFELPRSEYCVDDQKIFVLGAIHPSWVVSDNDDDIINEPIHLGLLYLDIHCELVYLDYWVRCRQVVFPWK